jgi:hypothetical protein
LGNLKEGTSTGDFDRRMKGALWGGAPSLGTLEDMLRTSPDAGISLFPAEGNLVFGGGARIPETLIDEWRAIVMGRLSARDSIKRTLGESSFTGEPER